MMTNSTAIDRVQTVAFDGGYGVVKALMPGHDAVMFPSVRGTARRIDFQEAELARRFAGDRISDDYGSWFVGDLALNQIPTGELLRLRGRTADEAAQGHQFRLCLLKVALGKLFAGLGLSGDDVLHIRLATGLPVDHLPGKDEFKRVLVGQHRIVTDAAQFIANITQVMIMPQPYGTLYSKMITSTGEINPCHTAIRTGVVDVGTYTTDLIVDVNGVWSGAKDSASVEGGVSSAHEYLSKIIEDRWHQKPDYASVETALRTCCFRAAGVDEDMTTEVESALTPLRRAVVNTMQQKWQAGLELDTIYLTGGGAPLVERAVCEAFPGALLVEGSQLANAQGYLNYALCKARPH